MPKYTSTKKIPINQSNKIDISHERKFWINTISLSVVCRVYGMRSTQWYSSVCSLTRETYQLRKAFDAILPTTQKAVECHKKCNPSRLLHTYLATSLSFVRTKWMPASLLSSSIFSSSAKTVSQFLHLSASTNRNPRKNLAITPRHVTSTEWEKRVEMSRSLLIITHAMNDVVSGWGGGGGLQKNTATYSSSSRIFARISALTFSMVSCCCWSRIHANTVSSSIKSPVTHNRKFIRQLAFSASTDSWPEVHILTCIHGYDKKQTDNPKNWPTRKFSFNEKAKKGKEILKNWKNEKLKKWKNRKNEK